MGNLDIQANDDIVWEMCTQVGPVGERVVHRSETSILKFFLLWFQPRLIDSGHESIPII